MTPLISAFAPITIGNFSVGFDVLGLCVRPIYGQPLGDVVELVEDDVFGFEVDGLFASEVPNGKRNLVWHTHDRVQALFNKSHNKKSPIKITLHKNLPVGSGLGSSAASIVAALLALNHYYDDFLTMKELLSLAAEMEAIYTGSPCLDNVAPCLAGGFQLMTQAEDLPIIPVPFPRHWRIVLFYNGSQVMTEHARSVLPETVDMKTAINHAKNLAVFIQALNLGSDDLAAEHLYDLLAAPHRESLFPHFSPFRDYARSHGAIATGISGAGPTVFAICKNDDDAEDIAHYARQKTVTDQGFVHVCEIDEMGAYLNHDDEDWPDMGFVEG